MKKFLQGMFGDKAKEEPAHAPAASEPDMRTEFMQMIAHDVRTPLTSLQTVLASLNRGSYGELNERGKERVAQAEQSLAYVVSLLTQLFEIDKLQSGEQLLLEYSTANVHDTCRSALEIAKPFADAQQVTLELEGIDADVEADHKRISQVILNLVANAIKHSPPESTVKVSLEQSPDSVHVRILDQGPGLERDLRGKAFERFTQFGDSASGGMGLGLAISKTIVEAHRGDIGFESQFGRGCCVWFRLPLMQRAA